MLLAGDGDDDLIETPLVGTGGRVTAYAGGEIPAKFLSPLAYRFVGYVDAAHDEHFLDHAQAQGSLKKNATIAKWAKEIVPSTDLRKWFGRDPARWDEFRERYVEELRRHPDEPGELWDMARRGTITLVFSTHDAVHNSAVVLRDVLLGRDAEA